jgi:autotransporter translocation and assembly factor TamB
VNPLGVQISAITVAGAVDPENIRIAQIVAQARDGRLQGSGTIALRNYAPADLKVSLSAERWPAIHTRQYQAEIGGEVQAEGPLTAARVTGRLEVLQATLRPDLAFLQDTPVQRGDTIVIRHTGSSSTPSAVEEEQEKTQRVFGKGRICKFSG